MPGRFYIIPVLLQHSNSNRPDKSKFSFQIYDYLMPFLCITRDHQWHRPLKEVISFKSFIIYYYRVS